MGTVASSRFGIRLRVRFAARESFPELAELLSEFGIFQITQAFACHYHDVPANQIFLIGPERLADLAFQAIALNRELDALLADHQAQTGMIELVVARKQQDILARSFAAGGVEDCLELPGG